MRKNIWLALLLVMIIPAMSMTVSCAKKQVETAPEPMAEETAPQVDEEAERAAEAARLRAEQLKAEADAMARETFVNDDIYFDFDSSVITPDAQILLRSKAAFMRNYPDTTVEVEGHCDERGTEAYNMALGERRAESAKSFLVNLGIDPLKIYTISYGEERPIDPDHNEAAWSRNRRGHFVIK